MTCERNVGGWDKRLRIAAGVIILLLGLVFQSWWGLVGILPLVVGLSGCCPLYPFINVNTAKGENKNEENPKE